MPVATEEHHRRIEEMTLASVYPDDVAKVENKGFLIRPCGGRRLRERAVFSGNRPFLSVKA